MIARTIGPVDWAVYAPWFGAERIVFFGPLFACTAFMARHRD